MISRAALLLRTANGARFQAAFRDALGVGFPGAASRRVSDVDQLSKSMRFLSTGGGSNDDDNNEDKTKKVDPIFGDDSEDVFGVSFEDGDDNLGPKESLPPNYIRDKATGRFTGEIKHEISAEDGRMLDMSVEEQERYLSDRIQKLWGKEGGEKLASKMGRHVREAEMGLNVLGRSVESQTVEEEDSTIKAKRKSKFSQRLSRDEFEGFREYMRKQYKKEITPDDIPVQDSSDLGGWGRSREFSTVDHPRLANNWTTYAGQRQMDPTKDDDIYSDLLPPDLNVQRVVNRRQAKRIPRELLHHNNVMLLKFFMTPTGQIKHRIQSRLGAKDQRIVSKLIKRARQMGLLPYSAQFATEQHGWVNAPDIHEKRDWEEELERRGLTIEKPPVPEHYDPDLIPKFF